MAAASFAAGCQQQDTAQKKTGSYTAARHNLTGSHIPQPYSADGSDSTMDTNADTNAYLREQERMNSTSGSIGGGRTR